MEKTAKSHETEMSEDDRKLVAAYQKKFDDSRVDTNLIMELLVILTSENEQGENRYLLTDAEILVLEKFVCIWLTSMYHTV